MLHVVTLRRQVDINLPTQNSGPHHVGRRSLVLGWAARHCAGHHYGCGNREKSGFAGYVAFKLGLLGTINGPVAHAVIHGALRSEIPETSDMRVLQNTLCNCLRTILYTHLK